MISSQKSSCILREQLAVCLQTEYHANLSPVHVLDQKIFKKKKKPFLTH